MCIAMGKQKRITAQRLFTIQLIKSILHNWTHWLSRCITWRGRSTMVRQKLFQHYRLMRQGLAAALTIGAAAFLGYLILLVRL